jgi:hypothetical protein
LAEAREAARADALDDGNDLLGGRREAAVVLDHEDDAALLGERRQFSERLDKPRDGRRLRPSLEARSAEDAAVLCAEAPGVVDGRADVLERLLDLAGVARKEVAARAVGGKLQPVAFQPRRKPLHLGLFVLPVVADQLDALDAGLSA